MAVGLLVLSRDPQFVEELRNHFSGRLTLRAVESLETARSRLEEVPGSAILAHLGAAMLNGYSPEAFVAGLGELAVDRRLFGVVEGACPAALRQSAERMACEILTEPVDFDRLADLLHDTVWPAVDPAGYGRGLPRRVLTGRRHALVTFAPNVFPLVDALRVAAAHEVTVPIVGESGTGKTYLARLIHEISPRRDRCFVALACGAQPPEVLDSELFGQGRATAPGIEGSRPGRLAMAGEGTILVGEIDLLTLDQQARLLRVVEQRRYEPAGSESDCPCRARFILTASSPLEGLFRSGKLRSDLYYHLSTLSFTLPPLRERPSDIEYLARKFAAEHSRSHRIELKEIDDRFLAALHAYAWPGNIRELEAVMRRAVLYSQRGILGVESLPPAIAATPENRIDPDDPPGNGSLDRAKCATLEQRVDDVERQIIVESLQRHNYHRIRTARDLGISRVTLYNKMKKFGMLS